MKTLRNIYKKTLQMISKFWKTHIIDELDPRDPNF